MSIGQNRSFLSPFTETIKDNGRLFTIFSIAVIVVSGLSIVENRENWWVLIAGIAAVFLVIFLYMNARVFIKIAVVSLLNLFMSTTAFQIGSFADSTGTGGLVWMSSIFFSFFSVLAVSYMVTSSKSRWPIIGVSTVLGFIITYALGIGGLNISLSALFGSIVSILSFVFLYKTGNKNKYLVSEMPTNILTSELDKKIIETFENNGWSATSLKSENEDSGTVLVWDEKCYILYPVYMDESFTSIETKKNVMLGYKDNNVNPWLLNLVFTKLPIWKSRNANINLILLDLNNNNGNSPRVIGVKVPDSKKPIPVGIIPSKSLLEESISNSTRDSSPTNPKKISNRQKHIAQKNLHKIDLKDPDDIITMIDAEMSLYTQPIKQKQRIAISRIGKVEEDLDKDSTKFVKRRGKNKTV